MMLYRLTIYTQNEKVVDEYRDEDELREAVDAAMNDIERKDIKSFTVSWISSAGRAYEKPFWEKCN